MKIENALRYLTALQQKSAAYTHAMSLLYFDSVTVAPADTADGRDDTYSVLSEAAYKLMSCKRTENALRVAKENLSRLTFVQQRQVESLTRDREEISKIPMAEYVEYQLLINRAENIWIKAKKANDYAMFAPYLQQIFGTTIRFAGYTDPGKDPYDVMLNRYERGLNCETADRFFAKLRSDIVPLIRKVSASRQPDISFIRGNFPIDRQRELTDYIMDVMCIDRSHCNVGETEHPFTIEFNNKDVRITTNYHLDDFTNSMYSVIHEGGHALYELGIGDEYRRTCLAGDTAMSIHESQSRLFENCIGRSAEFIDAVMPKLRELFGLDGVTERQM